MVNTTDEKTVYSSEIKCSWCGKTFSIIIGTTKEGWRSQVQCKYCGRPLPSSRKLMEDGKHTHMEYPRKKVWWN